MTLKSYKIERPLRTFRAIQDNPIPFLSTVLRESGDFVRLESLLFRFHLVNDPDLIREALVEKSDLFVIQGGAARGLAGLIGNGILTNRGSQWRESRRSLQPLFNQSAMERYPAEMQQLTQESLDRWRLKFRDRPFPISREILALSCRILCRNLFGYVPSFEEAEEFADALWVLQSDGMTRYLIGADLVSWLPIPLNQRVNRAKATLTGLAGKIIEHGASQSEDEILSLLFAGTESPANTICWVLKLLDQHPQWKAKASQDSHALSQVISEALRLYPAGWAFERMAAKDTTLGREPIRRNSRFLFSPFLLHRNPRFWKEPEAFDPDRFADGATAPAGVPKYAYLPFGAGPRSCIGSRMAWMEMRIILSMLLSQCRVKVLSGPEFIAKGSFKIRLSQPLLAQLE